MGTTRNWLSVCLTSLFISTDIVGVNADGTGLIGYGKTLYDPTCTFACRNVIRKHKLACTPVDTSTNHGTAHNPVSTPPECFVKDLVFLKTMALCIDTYCTLSDKPPVAKLEDYWAAHLGTGTLEDYQYVPLVSYHDALEAARQDEKNAMQNATSSASPSVPAGLVPYKVSSSLPITTGGSGALNATRLVSPVHWQLQYNYLYDFEVNEKGHSTMTITIAVVAIALPIILSIPQLIPSVTKSHTWTYLMSFLVFPATFGKKHREPVVGGMVPTRGQTLYVLLISFLNLILLIAPHTIHQPQASFTTRGNQMLSIIGNRAGTMAMGNVVALILFSSRNNPLMYITDWSYSTYLLLHRWLGYWAVLHTVIHSCALWAYYVKAGTYAAEILRLYWIWGIVGTVAACAILPLSLLKIRQVFYEFFIISHATLSLIFLIGYYYHIWYLFSYKWGYEIWMFVAAAIWAVERIVRIGRMAFRGSSTAIVTIVPDADEEYLRIDVEGKKFDTGVAYLCFPTLSWRFWETHPFSVSGCDLSSRPEMNLLNDSASNTGSQPSDQSTTVLHETVQSKEYGAVPKSEKQEDAVAHIHGSTFFARTRSGLTKQLLKKASQGERKQIRIRVLIDGPYNHSGRVHPQVAQCSSILCIAGGVGITACLPFLKQTSTPSKLFWSSRTDGLTKNLTPTLEILPANVSVKTVVGERLNLAAIIQEELHLRADAKGPLGIVVSGPPSLADDVRHEVVRVARGGQSRAYVLVDEAFGW